MRQRGDPVSDPFGIAEGTAHAPATLASVARRTALVR